MKKQSPDVLIGLRFGKLTVMEVLPTYRSGKSFKRRVRCQCDCGGSIDTRPEMLKLGRSVSCGCIGKQRLAEGRYKHGLHKHPLYKLWQNIKSRCYNVKSPGYGIYGGKGVKMCDEWLNNPISFVNWGIDKGWQKGLQLDKDKIALELGVPALLYSPERCQFLTPKENTNNRSITIFIEYNGERLCIADWADRLGIPKDRIDDRYRNGWPLDKILSTDNYSKNNKRNNFKKITV